LAAFALGCGGYIGGAKRAYHEGRYLEAAEKLHQHEPEINDLPPRKQADYGIYFGLSLLKLGDYAGAYRWFSFAHAVDRHRPGTLSAEQRGELDQGFWQLAQTPAAVPVFPPGALPPPQQTLVAPPPPPAPSSGSL
jgi:hypothetical protein